MYRKYDQGWQGVDICVMRKIDLKIYNYNYFSILSHVTCTTNESKYLPGFLEECNIKLKLKIIKK
jgi:hypothetical protein